MNLGRLQRIIDHYKQDIANRPDAWLIDCKNSKTIEQAIELAATAKNFAGKKHGHQNLIPTATLDKFAVELLNKVNDLQVASSFTDLIAIIEKCKIKGIADLTIYDTANRIGSFLGLTPDKIYLHRGTKTGAKKILGKIKGKTIDKTDLPLPFQNNNLTNGEIEDILCIYKNKFG